MRLKDRSRRQLALDLLFLALVVHFLLTGNVAPAALRDLLHGRPAEVAVTEPGSTEGLDAGPGAAGGG